MKQGSHAQEFLAIKTAIRKKRRGRRRKRLVGAILSAVIVLMMMYFGVAPAGRVREPMEFNAVPLREVLVVLERTYDVEIEEMESLRDCKFTGSFYDDSPARMVSTIADSFGASLIVTADGTFRIEGGSCR